MYSQASGNNASSTPPRKAQSSAPKVRKSVSSRVHEAVKAIALCHNVTPVYEARAGVTGETEYAEVDQDFSDENRTYQASSPDEVSWGLLKNLLSCCYSKYNTASSVFLLDSEGVRISSLLGNRGELHYVFSACF